MPSPIRPSSPRQMSSVEARQYAALLEAKVGKILSVAGEGKAQPTDIVNCCVLAAVMTLMANDVPQEQITEAIRRVADAATKSMTGRGVQPPSTPRRAPQPQPRPQYPQPTLKLAPQKGPKG